MTQLKNWIINPLSKITMMGERFSKNKLVNSINQSEASFVINNVAQYYWQSEQDFWDAETEFPNLAPPFETFWMEYKMPSKIHADGKYGFSKFKNLYIGFLVHSFLAEEIMKPEPNETNCKWLINLTMLHWAKKYPIIAMNPVILGIGIKQNGELGNFKEKPAWTYQFPKKLRPEVAEQLGSMIAIYAKAALLAISFLHCKNVEIKENHTIVPRRRKINEPVTKFYTLQIEPMKQILKTEGNSESAGLKNALHICRGHFKDFRDKGLFGKHKNIYWWNSQVRGNKRAGTINKDYEILN